MSDNIKKISEDDFPKIIELFDYLRFNPRIAGPLGVNTKRIIKLKEEHSYRIMNTAIQLIALEHLRYCANLIMTPFLQNLSEDGKSIQSPLVPINYLSNIYEELDSDSKDSLIPLFLSDGYFAELVTEKEIKKYKEMFRLAYIQLLKEDGLTFTEMKNSYLKNYPSSRKYPFLLGSLEQFNGKKLLSHAEATKIEKDNLKKQQKIKLKKQAKQEEMEVKWNSSSLAKKHRNEMKKFMSNNTLEIDEPRDLLWWVTTIAMFGIPVLVIYYLSDLGFDEVWRGNASGGSFFALLLPILWFFTLHKTPLKKGPHVHNQNRAESIKSRHQKEKEVFLFQSKKSS